MGREKRERRRAEQREKQRQRQIKVGAQVDPKKQPRTPQLLDVAEMHVEWSFELFDYRKDWRINADPQITFCAIGEFLKAYSGKTWKEILADKDRDHPMEQGSLSKAARDRLQEIGLDDYDTFWRFRFGGRQRLWGHQG